MKIKKSEMPWVVSDFETTGINEYEKTGRTRVWLYSICDSNDTILEDGDSLDSFMEWCKNHHGTLIYFHNLRFDGVFILSWLLEHNYPYEKKLLSHSKRGFSTLIGDLGEFYSITINFAPNKQVTLYDSLKLIPLSVRVIAKAFNMDISKGDIDYSDYKITSETIDYVHRDVRIVAKALRYFRDKGFYRMTIGSNAYHSYKEATPLFPLLFPRLDIDFIQAWRGAYRGGRTQVNPKYAGKILHGVNRYDINSMYPSIMAYKPLPYGKPIPCDRPGKYQFELYRVHIAFDLKKGHLPTLLKTGSVFAKAGDTYYTDSEGIIELTISNIDLELMKRHYNIYSIKYIEIVGFKTNIDSFRKWVEEKYQEKCNSTGGLKLVAKLTINSLYGKFGSKPLGRSKTPQLNEEGVLEFILGEEEDRGCYYLPVAIAIVSWAHKLIDDAIMEMGYDKFVYCDTDSVHGMGVLPSDWVDPIKLGKFKYEAYEETAKYIRQKTYITKEEGQWHMTCAGMPDGVKEYLIDRYKEDVINAFDIGLHVDIDSPGIKEKQLKLLPKRVPGGVILKPVPFSLL